MQLFKNIEQWKICRAQLSETASLGFVPTMGNLHAGHAALIQRSKQENDFTIVSIFVNPTQFNRAEDLHNYPRTVQADLQLLEESGVDFCLLPDYQDLYADNFRFRVEEHQLTSILEGPVRPGHFTGVLTVVLKLLMLTRAQRAYFGEKDYQQYRLIHDMADAFFLQSEIIAHPTIREADLLPYSSRNTRLNPQQRQKASQFAQLFHQPGVSLSEIEAALKEADIALEYLEEYEGRRYIAVMIDTIRLIDNYPCDCSDHTI